jgi:hypothetical protein
MDKIYEMELSFMSFIIVSLLLKIISLNFDIFLQRNIRMGFHQTILCSWNSKFIWIIFDHWNFFMLASDISRIWTKSMKLLFIPTKLKYICSFSTKNVTEKYHLCPISFIACLCNWFQEIYFGLTLLNQQGYITTVCIVDCYLLKLEKTICKWYIYIYTTWFLVQNWRKRKSEKHKSGSSLSPVVCRRALIYVICVCLGIVVSNTYCVVFLFCFSSSCVHYVPNIFFWVVHFWLPLRCSLTFIYIR